jgi:hypothetical protein
VRKKLFAACATLGLVALGSVAAAAHGQDREPRFRYVAGTQDVHPDCIGAVELTERSLVFRCAPSTVEVPYDTIEIMQYRSDVSRRVRHMKLNWREEPPLDSGGKNRYFTIVYLTDGTRHAIILRVPSDEMRPYLAEIDLKAGRRVDVQRHEDYE